MATVQLYAAVVFAFVITCLNQQTLGAVVRRALNEQITHFEPLKIHKSHVFRRASLFARDRRHTTAFVLPIKAFNRSLELDLKPAKHLFWPGGTVLRHTNESGHTTTSKLGHKGFYNGPLVGDTSRKTFAHVHISEEGEIHGIIVEGDEAMHIDPSRNHFEEPQSFDHVIYKEIDMKWTPPTTPIDEAYTSPILNYEKEEEPSGERKKRAIAYEKVTSPDYVKDKNICHMALWADKQFATAYGGIQGSVVKILQRFAILHEIFETTELSPNGNKMAADLIVAQIEVDESAELSYDDTAEGYLKAFSKKEGSRDWATFCLAHAFTYIDFKGTLGLAWTAYPDADNHNGGICQAEYKEKTGDLTSQNSAWTSSLNFGTRQPELQSALVLAHEVGHNFGALHDCSQDADQASCQSEQSSQANGVYLMYPFAANGNQENNDKFSSQSVDMMTASVADRGGCFLDQSEIAGVCGNFFTDTDEQCDCGNSTELCDELDKCCTAACTFSTGSKCSPLDETNGLCCDEDCQTLSDVSCSEQQVCKFGATCENGICPNATLRPDNSICQENVAVCKHDGDPECSGLCVAGECTGSICTLFGAEPCNADDGLVGAAGCEVKCKKDGACVFIEELGSMTGTAYDADNNTLTDGAQVIVKYKAAGSTCEFIKGQPTSGICNGKECLEASFEEDFLDDLFNEYSQIKDTFEKWANEENNGLANKWWLVIGGVLLLILCVCMCYITNRETNPKLNG